MRDQVDALYFKAIIGYAQHQLSNLKHKNHSCSKALSALVLLSILTNVVCAQEAFKDGAG